MSFIFQFLGGGNMKKKNDSSNVKPRSLRLESLETREMLSVGGLGVEPYALASSMTASAGYVAAAEVPTKLELTGTREETTGVDTLAWTDFGPGYTYTLTRNGIVAYQGTDTSFVDSGDFTLNKTFYVYTESAGERYVSEPVRLGPMYDLRLDLENVSTGIKLTWDNQNSYDPGTQYSYMLTRNGVTITPMLTGTTFIDTEAPAGNNTYVLCVYNHLTKKWTYSEAKIAGKLAAPTELSVTDRTKDSFTLNWNMDDTTGVDVYRVWLYQGSTLIGGTYRDVPVGTNYCEFEGLTPDTSYEYVVQAIARADAGLLTSSDVVKGNVTTASLLPQPTGFTATGVTVSTIDLQWNKVSDSRVTGYRIEWSTDGTTWYMSGTEAGTTHRITGLTAFTAYQIRISAVGTGGDESNPVLISQYTQLATPTDFKVASRLDKSITLSWTPPANKPSGNGEGYMIEWSTDGLAWSVQYEGPDATGSTVTNLTPGETYYFRLTAVVTSDPKVASESVSTSGKTAKALLAPPASLTATADPAGNAVTLNWPESTDSNVTGYKIEQIVDGEWSTVTPTTQTSNSATIDDLTPGVYQFRISSIGLDDDYVSDGSTLSNVVTVSASRPYGLKASDKTATGLTLSWTKPSNLDGVYGYEIRYSGGSVTVSGVDNTSYSFGNLSANTPYSFTVHSTDASGNVISAASDPLSVTTLLSTPVITSAVPAENEGWSNIVLNWTAVPGATGYEIQYGFKGTNWNGATTVTVMGTTVTSTTIGDLLASRDYDFRIRAVSGDASPWTNESEYSETKSAKTETHKLATPTGIDATATTTSITLSWNAVAGAAGYKIRYGTSENLTSDFVPAPNNECTPLNLEPGTVYYFEIYAVSGASGVIDSDVATFNTATLPLAVEYLTATANGSDSAKLTWYWPGNPLANTISGFQIQYKEKDAPDTDWTTISASLGSQAVSYTLPTGNGALLDPDTEYVFRIQALGADNNPPSAFTGSNDILTKLAAPTDLKAAIDPVSGDVVLTWKQPADFATSTMDGYVLQWMSVNDTDWDQAQSRDIGKDETSAKVQDLATGEYVFRLRAVNATNDSNAIEITADNSVVIDPTNLATPIVTWVVSTDHSITVSWTLDPKATGYYIAWAHAGQQYPEEMTNQTWDYETVGSTGSVTIDFWKTPETLLASGTEYVVWVTALADGFKNLSSEQGWVYASTDVETPVLSIDTAAVTTNMVELTWAPGNTTGVKRYEIHYTANGIGQTPIDDVSLAHYNSSTGLYVYYFQADANTPYEFWIVAVPNDKVRVQIGGAESKHESTRTLMGDPSNLTATMKDSTTVELAWYAADGATGYWVEWIYAYKENGEPQEWTHAGVVPYRTDVGNVLVHTFDTGDAGTAYKFRVQAYGGTDIESEYAYANTVTTKVADPSDLKAVSTGATSARLTWIPGSITGVASYTIRRREITANGDPIGNGQWTTIDDAYDRTASSYEDKSLTANKRYEYQIWANGYDTNANSNPITAKMNAVTNLTTPTNLKSSNVVWNGLTLAWDHDNIGMNGYEVQYQEPGDSTWTTISVTGKTATLTGLKPGQAYDLQVRAVNTVLGSENVSEWSDILTVTTAPVQLPEPTSITITDETVIDREDPANPTVSIKVSVKYPTVSPATYADWLTVTVSDGTYSETLALPYDSTKIDDYVFDFTGLAPDTEYTVTITVAGANAIEAEDVETFTTQIVAPTGLVATEIESESVLLTWTNPPAQKDVTGYKIEWSVDNWGTITDSKLVDLGVTSETITGLDAATTYSFRISSVSAAGVQNTDFCELGGIVTLPPMVEDFVVTPRAWSTTNLAWARLTWTEVPGTTYHVYWADSPDGTWNQVPANNVGSDALGGYAFVTQLVPGQTYWFSIAAVVGGIESTRVETSATMLKTTYDAPAIPAVVSGSVDVTELTLKWAPPAAGTRNDLYDADYGVRYSTDGGTTWESATANVYFDSTDWVAEVSELTPGETYLFVVYAKASDKAEQSADSAETVAPVTMLTNGPTFAEVIETHGDSVTISWIGPEDARGIAGYSVHFWKNGNWTQAGWTQETNFTIGDLQSFTTYTFYVYSYNSKSQLSPDYAETDATTLLGAARNVNVTAGATAGEADVVWKLPSFYEGIDVFEVVCVETGQTQTVQATSAIGGELNTTLDGLVSGNVYTVTITAYDADGSKWSDTVTAYYAEPVAEVTGVHVDIATSTSARVKWTLPSITDGIADYTVVCRKVSDDSIVDTKANLPASAAAAGVQFDGLLAGTDYYFDVTAIGKTVELPDGTNLKIDDSAAIRSLSVTQTSGGNRQLVTLDWQDYSGTEGFDHYIVQYAVGKNTDGEWDWVSVVTATPITTSTAALNLADAALIGKLNPGADAVFRVLARNASDETLSVVSETTVPKTLQMLYFAAPSATFNKTSLILTWTWSNNSDWRQFITGYEIETTTDGTTWVLLKTVDMVPLQLSYSETLTLPPGTTHIRIRPIGDPTLVTQRPSDWKVMDAV